LTAWIQPEDAARGGCTDTVERGRYKRRESF